ncbi:MAG TPA: hypothetical protein VHH34_09385, partial [Pseudonocardiaceae bacterium]|nr:hypothetical protein [Pseudonocardiaceae bacterium]
MANLTLLANTATEGSDGAIITGACFALAAVLLARRSHPDGPQGPNPGAGSRAPRTAGPTLLP